MAITISGASTQIPTNVVEIGNEISQNAINAISAANLPSTGNPFTTTNAAAGIAANYTSNRVIRSQQGSAGWSGFTLNSQFPLLVYNHYTDTWWPMAPYGSLLGYDDNSGGSFDAEYNFDFTDEQGNYRYLNGTASVGTTYSTAYFAYGYWDSSNNTTYYTGSYSSNIPANGPSYAGNWDNPVSSTEWYDSSWNYWYRYVYLDGNGGFYTADNQNNPPY